MVALKTTVLAVAAAVLSGAAIAQTVPSMQDATLPLTNQEFLFISQNGQPRRVHPFSVGAPLSVPNAPLLGGAGNALTVVTPQAPLSVSSGTLSLAVPTASLLGGASDDFTSVNLGSELAISTGDLNLTPTGVTPGDYLNANISINQYGRITAAANGIQCGAGLDLGTVLFADGANGCTGDTARLFWDTTTDIASGHTLAVTGGNLLGHVVNIQADQLGGWNPALSTLFLGDNNSDPTHPYGIVGSWGTLSTPIRTSINPDGGTVAMGAGSSDFGLTDPIASLVNNHDADAWTAAWGSALAFRGGVWNKNTHDADSTATELRLWRGATERARISADTAGTSFVPNRFTGAGLTDNTLVSCGAANSALQTDISGNLVCGTISGGGGGVTASGTLTTHAPIIGNGGSVVKALAALTNGQLAIGSTGADPVPSTLTAGAGVTITTGAGSITIASSGGGAGNGYLQPVLSAVPTSSGTGLTTSLNLGTATASNGLTGYNVCGATNAGQLEGVTKTAPSTPYNVDVVIEPTYYSGTNGFGPLFGWTDGTKLEVFMLAMSSNGTNTLFVLDYATTGSGAAATNIRAQIGGGSSGRPVALRISDDGTNVSFSVSPAGDYTHAQAIYTVAKASGFLANYNNLYYGINASNGNLCGTLLSYAQR